MSPKALAPFDMTGYWVSIVTEDWRFRMVTPAKGDYLGVPMTLESKRVADAWDPAKDEAAGKQCKSYGAAGIMRLPERLHITWQDDNTLRMDIDAGTQTRLLHFEIGRRLAALPRCREIRRRLGSYSGRSPTPWGRHSPPPVPHTPEPWQYRPPTCAPATCARTASLMARTR